MRIPKFDDLGYNKCYCHKEEYTYISKKCLHKLCDSCYNNKFKIYGAKLICEYCKIELYQEDFTKIPPLQLHYDEDLKRRKIINDLVYKRRENFSTDDEYNNYLECVEKLVQRKIENEIEKKYPQTKMEKKENYEKREKELEEIKINLKENSPMHYNSSKFCFDFEGNEINPAELIVETTQFVEVKEIKKKMKYIHDLEKEKKTGGYNINKIYEFLAIYSKNGFKNNLIIN